MGVEYEWKFAAKPELLPVIEDAFPGDGVTFQMETTYFDTPTGALSARHYTLRKRLENNLSVCTLKTPAGSARAEWEIHCENIGDAIKQLKNTDCPANFFAMVQEGVIPICGARFTRLAKTLEIPGGTVELALDQGVLIGRGKELPFAEVEVELKEGTDEAAVAFAKALAEEFGLVPEGKSKFARAMALAMG